MASKTVSELRIVVLGKNVPETCRVGNFILRRNAFETKTPPPSVEQHSERARGQVEGRYITLIHTPHLFNTELTQEELNQRVKECMTLSAPGPHVFLLVLQSDKFTNEDQGRIRRVLDSYGPLAVKHSVVLTTGEGHDTRGHLYTFIRECGGTHHMSKCNKVHLLHLLKKIEQVVEQNGGEHLSCEMTDVPVLGFKEGNQTGPSGRGPDQTTGTAMMDEGDQELEDFTVVLFGNTSAIHFGEENILLGREQTSPGSCGSSLIVPRQRNISGCDVSVISMFNAELYVDSIDQFTRQLVDENEIHAFIFILQMEKLTDSDKLGLEWVQSRFGESVLPYVMILFTYEREDDCDTIIDDLKKNSVLEELLKKCGNRYHTCSKSMNNQSEMRTLLEKVRLLSENNQHCYTSEMYHTAARLRSHQPETKTRRRVSELRIVVLGKNVPETSRVENFILRRNAFETKTPPPSVEQHSERARGQVEGRYITLIHTPHLFNTELTQEELNQRVKECVTLSAPGPHVFLLVLQSDKFTNEDQGRIRRVLDSYGPLAVKHSVVLTTGEGHDTRGHLSTFIRECGEMHHMSKCNNVQLLHLLKKIYKVVEQNGGEHLIYKMTDVPVLGFKEGNQTGPSGRGPDQTTGTAMMDDGEMLQEQSNVESKKKRFSYNTAARLRSHQPKTKTRRSEGALMEMSNVFKRHVGQKTPLHLNMFVLGNKGAGKTSTGNTIIGREGFTLDKTSKSLCVQKQSVTIEGVKLEVYVVHDSEVDKEDTMRMCQLSCDFYGSIPTVFLLVIKADRCTTEKTSVCSSHFEKLPHWILQNTWILFTGGDELERENLSIENFIEEKEELKMIVKKLQNRYHVFNNKNKHPNQVKHLIDKIRKAPLEVSPWIQKFQRTKPSEPEKNPNERRIVLLGKTGVGKSAAGNTILGENRFRSQQCFSSVTKHSEMHEAVVAKRMLVVVDTPGLFDTNISYKELKVEIGRSIYIASPGPHAFLYVHPIYGRFTEQEEEVVNTLEMMFGEEMRKYMITLFTHGDSLEDEDIDKSIKENRALRSLSEKCRGYHIFNNKDLGNRKQVTELLEKIDKMVEQNGGSCYSNQMFEDAAKIRQEEEERRQIEEMETKHKEIKQRQNDMEMFKKETEKRIMKETARKMAALNIKQEKDRREAEQKQLKEKEQESKIKEKDRIDHRKSWRINIEKKEKKESKKEKVVKVNVREDMKMQGSQITDNRIKQTKQTPRTDERTMNQARSRNVNSAANDPGLDRFLKAHHNHLAAAGHIGARHILTGASAGFLTGAGVGGLMGLIAGPVGAGIGLAVGGLVGGALGAAGGTVAALTYP